MNISLALNAIFGSILIVILIFVNYIRKFNSDRIQRDIFSRLLIFHFIAMISDMVYLLLDGMPGRHIYIILYIICVIYYLFQVLSFCYMIVFVDYMVFKNEARSKKFIYSSYIYFIFHAIALLINYKYGFYFYIDLEINKFFQGNQFYLRYIYAFLPMFFGLGILVYGYSSFKKPDVIMLSVFMSFFIVGSGLDLLLNTIRLVWPWGTSALLYAYFFIVQSDARSDPLTGIGNRFSFNEFTDKLSRRFTGESWAIVMIDMDQFKAINDTLGHQEGDNALCDITAIIKAKISKSDFLARYGGDEFFLASKIEKDGKNKIAEMMGEIKTSLDQFNLKNSRPYKLEISYGYDVYKTDGTMSVENFFNHIDSLMYKDKEERRKQTERRKRTEWRRADDKITGAAT